MIEKAFPDGSETGIHDTRESHPVEKMSQDGVGANQIDFETRRASLGDNAAGSSVFSCIQDNKYVYQSHAFVNHQIGSVPRSDPETTGSPSPVDPSTPGHGGGIRVRREGNLRQIHLPLRLSKYGASPNNLPLQRIQRTSPMQAHPAGRLGTASHRSQILFRFQRQFEEAPPPLTQRTGDWRGD